MAQTRQKYEKQLKKLNEEFKVTVHESEEYDGEDNFIYCTYYPKFNGEVDYTKQIKDYFI